MLVIPLLLKALADPVVSEDVIFNLKLEYRSPAGEFGRMLAPAVLPLCGGNTAAMQLLFKLDREFAGKSLVTAENLAPGSDAAVWILSCCTEVGLPVPRELLDPLVVAWNQLASDKWRLGNAVRALALHSNSDALNEAEFMILLHPQNADDYSDFLLQAAGLGGLFESLVEHSFTLEQWAALPDQAKIYFTEKNFASPLPFGHCLRRRR